MSDQPVRFAYVGCGFVAQSIHIPNFAAQPNCNFMAVAEVRKELGQSVAQRFGIKKVYRSHEEIAADKDIEAVGVSGPYALQGRIAQDLLKAGKHVFMEKPMAVSVKRADEIVNVLKQGKARLMVGYMKRYDTGNILLKKQLDAWRASGEAGNLLLARNHGFGGNWTYQQDQNVKFEGSNDPAPPSPDECPSWLPDQWKNAYLGYLQQWTHNINLLRFFLNDVEGTAKVKAVDLDKDGMTGIVVLDINGTRATVESGYTNFHAWEEHTQIYFQKGYLKTDAPPLMLKETPATVEVYKAGSKETPASLSHQYAAPSWSYREEARHFLKGVQTGEAFRSSGEDTATDVRLYEDIYKQFLNK
jgi:predicted dehydrogenase